MDLFEKLLEDEEYSGLLDEYSRVYSKILNETPIFKRKKIMGGLVGELLEIQGEVFRRRFDFSRRCFGCKRKQVNR